MKPYIITIERQYGSGGKTVGKMLAKKLNVPVLVCCLVAAIAAAVGTYFGVRVMRVLANHNGISDFAYYSFGAALFAFILYLMV